MTPCALGRSWFLYVYKTLVSMESEWSCFFGSLRIQDSSLNGVRVFLCLWTLVLYVSSGSILETSPSLGTRPPTTLAWLFSLLRHHRKLSYPCFSGHSADTPEHPAGTLETHLPLRTRPLQLRLSCNLFSDISDEKDCSSPPIPPRKGSDSVSLI